jgi:outer membrane protein TolC
MMASVAAAQTRPSVPTQLTLAQALDIALSNSSTLREAQANLDQASGQYEQARSVLLPQVEVNARQSYLTINLQGIGIDAPNLPTGAIDPFGSMDARIRLTQDLLNIAGIRAWRSYNSRRESSQFLVDNAREVITLNVVGAYLQALRTKAYRDSLVEQTRLANELYRITADRLQQGVASELDANRARQQVNSLEQQRQEAEQNYVAAKLELALILQTSITANFDVSDQAAYGTQQTMDTNATVQLALTSRPDYRAAQATVRAADLQLQSAKASRFPTVQMVVDDGQSGNSPVRNVNTYRVQGSINFPVFTGGRIRGEIHESEGALRNAMAALERNRSQIESDVLTALSGVERALQEVEISAQNVGLARQEVDLTRARFSQGVTDNTEVVNAQDRLSRADDSRIRAQYRLGLSRANLARASGAAEQTYRR